MYDINEPWKVKFLESAFGAQFLSTVQNNKECIIAIEKSEDVENTTKNNKASHHQVSLLDTKIQLRNEIVVSF